MKVNLTEKRIELVPENFADKLYLRHFAINAQEEQQDGNMELSYLYQNKGGYADPQLVVDEEFTALDDKDSELIATEWITGLDITYFKL